MDPHPLSKKGHMRENRGTYFGARQGGLIIFEFSPEKNHPF